MFRHPMHCLWLARTCLLAVLLAVSGGPPESRALAATPSDATTGNADQEVTTRLDAAFGLIERAVAQDEIPGAVVLVARRGSVVREAAYGWRDLKNRIPFRTDTICWLASITKPVTAVAVMKLVEQGKLSLDARVEDYLPQFKSQKTKDGRHYAITVRQLLTHTSGLPESPPNRQDIFTPDWYSKTLAEVVPPIAEAQLQFRPEARVQYSNTGYYVLGRLVELAAGKPYVEFVREQVLIPLGMNDSFFASAAPSSAGDRLAVVYRQQKGNRREFFRFDPHIKMVNGMADGGLFSTARDLLKFCQMFLDNDGRVLERQSVDEMLREQVPGRGLGWSLRHGGFAHGGSSGAFTWGDLDRGLVGVLLVQDNDFGRIQCLRSQFVEEVRKVFGPATPSPALEINQYQSKDLLLRSSTQYENPVRDAQLSAVLSSPSGRTLKVAGLSSELGRWIVRLSFDEPGIWRVVTSSNPFDPNLSSNFTLEVLPSKAKK